RSARSESKGKLIYDVHKTTFGAGIIRNGRARNGRARNRRARNGPKVTQVLSKDLTDFPGKEGLMLTVEYPPGGADPVHRHNAHAFVYVLEGSIVMQLQGGKEVTLTAGQTFYEGPDDVHVIGRNASQTSEIRRVTGEGQRRSGAGARQISV